MKAYPIITVECPSQAGGVDRAKSIIAKMISQVGGLSDEEFNKECKFEVTHNQVCVLIPDHKTAKRIVSWKHNMNNTMWGYRRNRQVSGYMFHSINQTRNI